MSVDKHQPDERSVPLCCSLSEADAAVLDRLLAGEAVAAQADAERARRVARLLGLLDGWRADEPAAGLGDRALAGVLSADPPVLSRADGEALDGLLALRGAGLEAGPMPAGSGERAERVAGVLSLLDRAAEADAEAEQAVPVGLAQRTLAAVERDRAAQRQRRSAMRIGGSGEARPGGFNLRQLATTAALLLMVLSVLVPMLDQGRRDAMVTRCSANLAGLGVDLRSYAMDHKGSASAVDGPATAADAAPDALPGGSAGIFGPLSGFARKALDGSDVPASRVNLYLLLDEQRIDSRHMTCPSGAPGKGEGYYSGQNPVAGGPLRVFLQPRPIFADSNPLYRVTPTGLARKPGVPGLTRSANHDAAGQNLLYSDGSVRWTVRPAVFKAGEQEDNIWLLQRPVDPTRPGDREADVFLTP